MNQVLIVSESSAEKGNPEGKLGNITCDMILKKANDYATQQNLKAVYFCLLNNGGLRAPLPKGPITKGKVFELMPFENELVVLTLTGKKTKQLFETVAKEKGMPIGGARIFVHDSAAPSIQIGAKDFDESKSYRVVTSDYLSAGGDKMFFFKAPEMVDTLHHKLRDAIIEYMVEENKIGHTLNPQLDGRITYKK
jgi:2',3'-cyclic-nucleotide 2'-phosphodiesterase (5'-nucleotidase family)